ncbi:MAG: DUF192 domain-containing protein [Acidimicrobiales bacterium]
MSRRLRPAVVAALLLTTALAGCRSTDPTPEAGATGTSGSSARVAGTVPGATATRSILPGFEQVTVRVTAADGTVRTWCLLLARTEAQRQRGLMEVADPDLGGHAGMLFTFDEDVLVGFWMRDTVLPLSIAYLGADGRTVSTADMAPCPAGSASCPTYAPTGRYRSAIEVPQGRLPDLGIGEGSRVEVVGPGCA